MVGATAQASGGFERAKTMARAKGRTLFLVANSRAQLEVE
jgi:hypothetical protein